MGGGRLLLPVRVQVLAEANPDLAAGLALVLGAPEGVEASHKRCSSC